MSINGRCLHASIIDQKFSSQFSPCRLLLVALTIIIVALAFPYYALNGKDAWTGGGVVTGRCRQSENI